MLFPVPTHRRSQHGIALVVVLAMLVLVTLLIVGFFQRTTSERSSTQAYSDQNQTQFLADQAVNIVQAQITHAASQATGWASQPGMVRTFQQDGTLHQAYKLYSDADMVSTSVDIAAAVDALDQWEESPALFVDLNAPKAREPGDGLVYPIIDPAALPTGSTTEIQGFSITDAPGSTLEQPAPMPVRWLYVLKDGSAVAPTGTGSTASVAGASTANPIIGRIAFWADDETAKLNINTAAHGSFWDIPRAFSKEERDRMARFQPAQREYQRYPGHPSTTSLWPALGYLFANEIDFAAFIYGDPAVQKAGFNPRIRPGGSKGGTVLATSPVQLINPPPRLYTSVEEAIFNPDRTALLFPTSDTADQEALDEAALARRDAMEKSKFFLTARSNAPELNLFNRPRIAIWPINMSPLTPSTLDQLIAFCSTVNHVAYYFTRADANSPSNDFHSENQKLYAYLLDFLSKPFPGYGTASFIDKYTEEETQQIATEIFDYIRSSNLYSTSLGATPYTGETATSDPNQAGSQVGQVAPLEIGDTKGFGRVPVLTRPILQFYVSGVEQADNPSNIFSGTLVANAPAPRYNAPIGGNDSYSQLKTFLDTAGVGKEVDLLTTGIVYFDTFDPMYGYVFPRYKYDIEVSFSGTWTLNGKPLNFPSSSTIAITRDQSAVFDSKRANINQASSIWMGRFLGGLLGPHWMMQNYRSLRGHKGHASLAQYPLVSNQVKVHTPLTLVDAKATNDPKAKPMLPSAATIGDKVNFSGGKIEARIKINGQVIQTYIFDFPAFSGKPAPSYASENPEPVPGGSVDYHIPLHTNAPDGAVTHTVDEMVLKQFAASSNFRNRWIHQHGSHRYLQRTASSTTADYPDLSLIQSYDVAVSLEPAYGDKRLLGTRPVLKSGSTPGKDINFVPHQDYTNSALRRAVDLRIDPFGNVRRSEAELANTRPGRILNIPYGTNAMPDIPSRYKNGVPTADASGNIAVGNFVPDFDNGTLHAPDDAYINRADEGSGYDALGTTDHFNERYFAWYWDIPDGKGKSFFDAPTFFSPNKQMPSAVMFGSLPTGAVRNHPWQTLLLRPAPAHHPGAVEPPDHLLLDLFWMPVVEPYAISEPFSTNGKVNMNYQIMPFGYIHRSTALLGVLHSQEIVSIADADAYSGAPIEPIGYGTKNPAYIPSKSGDEYKTYNEGTATAISGRNFRRKLNLSTTDGTLRTFEDRFAANDVFHSETEICNVPLIPSDAVWDADFETTYWGSRRLTGDNSREMPYAHLLPRLTTKSNTYKVHFRVQSLRKVTGTAADEWDENKDKVVAEYRGSRTIERYIDPNDNRIPNYKEKAPGEETPGEDPTVVAGLETYYRWRALNNQAFAP